VSTIPPNNNPSGQEDTITAYGDRLRAGHYNADTAPEPEPELDPDNLPSRHAALDELATARGVTFKGDNLTVADKQEQLAAALEQ
jgi:hypothetical protein